MQKEIMSLISNNVFLFNDSKVCFKKKVILKHSKASNTSRKKPIIVMLSPSKNNSPEKKQITLGKKGEKIVLLYIFFPKIRIITRSIVSAHMYLKL